VFTLQVEDLQAFSTFAVGHSYPHGSVYVETVTDPSRQGMNLSITIWGTKEYLDSVDVRALTLWARHPPTSQGLLFCLVLGVPCVAPELPRSDADSMCTCVDRLFPGGHDAAIILPC
jgi:hypothetical protein